MVAYPWASRFEFLAHSSSCCPQFRGLSARASTNSEQSFSLWTRSLARSLHLTARWPDSTMLQRPRRNHPQCFMDSSQTGWVLICKMQEMVLSWGGERGLSGGIRWIVFGINTICVRRRHFVHTHYNLQNLLNLNTIKTWNNTLNIVYEKNICTTLAPEQVSPSHHFGALTGEEDHWSQQASSEAKFFSRAPPSVSHNQHWTK